jgi:hypothetical protein
MVLKAMRSIVRRRRTGQRKSAAGRAPPHHEGLFYFPYASRILAWIFAMPDIQRS